MKKTLSPFHFSLCHPQLSRGLVPWMDVKCLCSFRYHMRLIKRNSLFCGSFFFLIKKTFPEPPRMQRILARSIISLLNKKSWRQRDKPIHTQSQENLQDKTWHPCECHTNKLCLIRQDCIACKCTTSDTATQGNG